MQKKRNSSMELLRIICMLLIIAHHYSVHGGYEIISYENISISRIFIQLISMFGRMSCTIFALMTGYFCIDGVNKQIEKKAIYLVAILTVYSITIWIFVYGLKLIPISFTQNIKSLFPILWGNWYVVYYVLFVMFVPFINSWIKTIKENEMRKLIVILIIVWCIIPTLTMPIATASGFGPIGFFFVSYLIGAYIKLYYFHNKNKNSVYLGIGVSMMIVMLLSVLLFDMLGYILKMDSFIVRATCYKEYNSIFAFLGAVYIFIYFVNLNYQNRYINRVAEAMVGVYIIHDNELLREYIWRVVSPNSQFIDFPYIHSVVKIVAVFVICLILDIVFTETIGKVIKRFIDRNYDKIKSKLFYKMGRYRK